MVLESSMRMIDLMYFGDYNLKSLCVCFRHTDSGRHFDGCICNLGYAKVAVR